MQSLKGHWVFINYWASWCEACVEEIQQLNQFYDENQQRMLLFAVNYEDLELGQQHSLIKQLGIRYPSLKDDPSDSLNLGEITVLPMTFVLNPQGQLVKTLYGSVTRRRLAAILTSEAQAPR
jgi:thiol-disulfide isomerase/thioredoxin